MHAHAVFHFVCNQCVLNFGVRFSLFALDLPNHLSHCLVTCEEMLHFPCFSLSWVSLVAQMVKNPPAMWETWVGKIPWRRAWQPTPVLLPGESHGWRSLAGHSPWGRKASDTTWLSEWAQDLPDLGLAQLCSFTLVWWVYSSSAISKANLKGRHLNEWLLSTLITKIITFICP